MHARTCIKTYTTTCASVHAHIYFLKVFHIHLNNKKIIYVNTNSLYFIGKKKKPQTNNIFIILCLSIKGLPNVYLYMSFANSEKVIN